MLPLAMISTPSSRSGASLAPSSRWYSQGLGAVEGQLHDGHVGVGERVDEHGPGAVVDAPAVVVAPDPHGVGGPLHGLRPGRDRRAPGTATANSSSGNPKKSWMVRGAAMAVTAEALMNQCAEIDRMARGRGTDAPNADQASV